MAEIVQTPTIRRLSSQRTKVSMLFRDVCEQLRQYVTSLGPGVELSEVSLSQQLGISRTPVREALIQLSNEGLVQFRSNGRCHVTELSQQDIADMSDIRTALEAAAARALVPKITEDQVAELRRLATVADEELKHGKVRAEWDRAEEAFHHRFLEMAGNTHIFNILERQGLMERLLTLPIEGWRELADHDDTPDHKAVVDALAARDADLAEQLFREHAESRKIWLMGMHRKGMGG